MKPTSGLKVAIVHDWLVGGGAERVVLELHRMFPEAPIYTSYCIPEWRKKLDDKVITGYLQRWPFGRLRKFLPALRGRWFASLDLSGYDLVIASSGNGEANHVRPPQDVPFVCYVHAPTHFYWRHYDQYLKEPGFGVLNPLARLGLRLLVKPLRQRDYQAAQRPNVLVANSTHIQAEIKQFYGRESEVVHPPVDVERFTAANAEDHQGFVTVGRQVPYKRVDVLIEACNQLQLPLRVIGRGPDHARLVKLAGPTVSFETDVSDEALPSAIASAEAFLFAAYEDFGIAPVEAMATGTPLIAYQAGGALDYVQPGKTGEFFQEQRAESLATTLKDFKATKYNRDDIKHVAEAFNSAHFQENLLLVLQHVLQ